MTILGCKLLLGIGDKLVVDFVLNKVDGATTEATTHDAATCYAILLGYVVEIVELLARNLILLRKSMCVSYIF